MRESWVRVPSGPLSVLLYQMHKYCMNEFNCIYCGKPCKNANSKRNHERLCKSNPNRQESSWVKFNQTHEAWNKGLTAETDERVAKSKMTLKEGFATGRNVSQQKGKAHTDEEKQKISESRKRYLAEHPDKVPYVLNHHSKGDSFPEQYFKTVLDNAHIEYKQNFYQCGYFLDFAWPDKKLYLEVDGEQHYLDERIVEHDRQRTQTLSDNGWTCIERIRWSAYQSLTDAEKKDYLEKLLQNI